MSHTRETIYCIAYPFRRKAFAFPKPYRGYHRGAEWHRWDLHIHTPASIEQSYGDPDSDSTWKDYIHALARLPHAIRAVGITDYNSVDGYRRVRKAHEDGLLPNLDLILPVVELRLTTFVGSRDLRKLNFHIVFSDELSADQIEEFFLRQLNVELQLDGSDPWRGCVGTRAGLLELGAAIVEATPDAIRTGHSALQVGFANAAVDPKTLQNALRQSVFRDRTLTALGAGEWTQMRWDGAGTAQKRDAIERVDMVLTAAPTLAKYEERRTELQNAGVNSRLIHGSDAHHFAESAEPNRLGGSMTWIKADLTFQGLRRALVRFDDRVFVGDMPPKLQRIQSHRRRYIDSLRIEKKKGSSLSEVWFDALIELNPDLVAVIGNQGSGKSALTDIIALCGQSRVEAFSFLNADKFRDKQKRAGQFIATMRWSDGSTTTMQLDETVPSSVIEQVRYVPQGFFDGATNEKTVSVGGTFYTEIKNAIFSHIDHSDRLGATSLDELVRKHSEAAENELSELRNELAALNRDIVVLEEASSAGAVARLTAAIKQRELEIAALTSSEPAPVPPPETASVSGAEMQLLLSDLEKLRTEIERTEGSRARVNTQSNALTQTLQALEGEERRVRSVIHRLQRELDRAGLTLDASRALSVSLDTTSLDELRASLRREILAIDSALDPDVDDSLANQRRQHQARLEHLKLEADRAASAYQAHLAAMTEWRARLSSLRGDTNPSPESLRGLESRLAEAKTAHPKSLADLRARRQEKCREIYGALNRLALVHERIAEPVRQHIARHRLTRERYQLAFDVHVGEAGLADRLFGMVSQQSGTFAGQLLGRERLKQTVVGADFSSADGAIAFADTLLDHLERDHKNNPPAPVSLSALLKKGTTLEELYDLVYSLEYLVPVFELGLNGKPLHRLSPGERGILLLVFYLVVDNGEEPLIIDQPEGNLNNQSIVAHLVPVILAAKGRRQIIIVTHNPNIAVVCDAEQIVHCEMTQDESHRIVYTTGALENPRFNQLSLDVLEGTASALGARVDTYDQMDGRRLGTVELPVVDWPV